MTAFTIIAYVIGLIVTLSLLFGLISIVDGFVNKLPAKIKMGTILFTVAVVLFTIGGVQVCKKCYKQRKYELYNQWYNNNLQYKEFQMEKCEMMCKDGVKDSTCCPKGDSTMVKNCDPSKACKPGMCEHHKK